MKHVRKYRILLLVAVLLLGAALTGCKKASGDFSNKTVITGEDLMLTYEGQEKIIENESYRMEFTKDYSEFTLTDKKNNTTWVSSMNDESFDTGGVNAMWQKKLSSLFHINYTNLKKGLGAIVASPLLTMEYTAVGEYIEDGIAVTYNLIQPQIQLTLLFTLDEEGFRIMIPSEEIVEKGEFSIVSIDMLPYFAGASDQTEGYYLYPDGSGAIMEFTDNSHKNEKAMSYNIYGNIEKYSSMAIDFMKEEPEVLLPVFGAKLEENGFLAIITRNEENSRINLNCSNDVIAANGIWCQFLFRRGFEDPRVKTKKVLTYDEKLILGDREIYYRLLTTGNADYSAMAANYRNYLMGEGVSYALEGTMPMMLDLFLGIEEKGLLYNEFQRATTFLQGAEMITGLQAGGILAMDITLKGWTKNGYQSEPKQFPVNSSVGGESELKELISTAQSFGFPVMLEANLMEARSEYKGFSKRNDVAYLGNHMILTDADEELFLLSPNLVGQAAYSVMEKANNLGIEGFRFYGLGSNIYYNYNNSLYLTASDCKLDWMKILNKSNQSYGSTAVGGGNSYVFGSVDRITNIPSDDRGYMFTTTEVPFYQMVVHGMAGYTGLAGNLSSDLEREKLKWIEYGYLPYFELTYEGSKDLMYTGYNSLFSSEYSQWKERVISVYLEMQGAVGDLWNKTILRHESVLPEVYKVTYSNQTKVYVNYSNQDVTVDGTIIKALDYAVVREAGQ